MLKSSLIIGTFLLAAAGASEGNPTDRVTSGAASEKRICQFVVESKAGAKPFQMCMTRREWDEKKRADARDVNRLVCRYEEVPGTRFRSRKVCQTAAEWDNQRQQDRQAVERIQSGVCVPAAGC